MLPTNTCNEEHLAPLIDVHNETGKRDQSTSQEKYKSLNLKVRSHCLYDICMETPRMEFNRLAQLKSFNVVHFEHEHNPLYKYI